MTLKVCTCLYFAVLLLSSLGVYAENDSNLNGEARNFVARLVRSPNPRAHGSYGIVYSNEGEPLGVLQVSDIKKPTFNLYFSTFTAF